jgi:hypothetical protein
MPVGELAGGLNALSTARGVEIEHIYDY